MRGVWGLPPKKRAETFEYLLLRDFWRSGRSLPLWKRYWRSAQLIRMFIGLRIYARLDLVSAFRNGGHWAQTRRAGNTIYHWRLCKKRLKTYGAAFEVREAPARCFSILVGVAGGILAVLWLQEVQWPAASKFLLTILAAMLTTFTSNWYIFTAGEEKRVAINAWFIFLVLAGFFASTFGGFDVDAYLNWFWAEWVGLIVTLFGLIIIFGIIIEGPWATLWKRNPWPATVAACAMAIALLYGLAQLIHISPVVRLSLLLLTHMAIMLLWPAKKVGGENSPAINSARSHDDYPVVTWRQFLIHKNRGSAHERKINTTAFWGTGVAGAAALYAASYFLDLGGGYGVAAIFIGLFALPLLLTGIVGGVGFSLSMLRYVLWWSWHGVNWDGTVCQKGTAYVTPSDDERELLFCFAVTGPLTFPGYSSSFPYRELASFMEMSQKEWHGPIEHQFEFMESILVVAYRHGQGAAAIAQLGVTTHAEVFDLLVALTNAFVKDQATHLRRFELENEAKETRPEADGSASTRDRPAV